MKCLIIKLGATGDVLRTTALLRQLVGEVTWITEAKNTPLLNGALANCQCLAWEQRATISDNEFDLVINLEDSLEVGSFLKTVKSRRSFGAFLDNEDKLRYTMDAAPWFDLSLISRFGKQRADELKFENRRSYQDLIFSSLGYSFAGESYLLPEPTPTDLAGDVAIAPEAGPVWPMKNWAYYAELKHELESRGLTVNYLPRRATLLEHLADVRNHHCLVGGDSLPMHFALGTGTRCVTLFTCTSPWEIYDYGLQRKIVSPMLGEFWYKRGFDARATIAISLEEVLTATLGQIQWTSASLKLHKSEHS